MSSYTLYDFITVQYHDEVERENAVERFKREVIDDFEKFLNEDCLDEFDAPLLVVSDIDIADVLHQSKHEIERFSHLHLVENPALHYKEGSLPELYMKEYDKIPPYGKKHGLVGNLMSSNVYRQAASFVYWITKLKPIVEIRTKKASTSPSVRRISFLEKFINEYFAFYVASGIICPVGMVKNDSKFEIEHTDLESFLHLLRFKNTSPESLALLLEFWFKNKET